uniref:Small ribosomal subunit protein uS5c n=1 Tax=Pleurocladia lacustris TaxID=246121 RepID=A0A1I9LVF8_9PHAE|nr:30S ribosomal protein S5 [Pleurocladia lacustris]ANS57578.1 30S ribosomal protein S5 [Pleurocladia lacustris]ANS57722.1 30S ribosomal protein S5 [Pleurocladia lacustris]
MTTENKKSSWEKRVVKISRVSKVVKGGKKISFRATVVVGDIEKKQVGVGVGKAKDVSTAVKKAETDGIKNVINVQIAEGKTIPHATFGIECGSKVFIRPAVPGTGVIAGGSVRIVLELAGIKNILSKQLGSNNSLNNARSTITALKSLSTVKQVMEKRQISLEQVLGK